LDFIESAESAETIVDLQATLTRTLQSFGAPNYTLAAMMRDGANGALRFRTLMRGVTQEWADHYWAERYFNVDAAVHMAMQRATAFSWSEVEARRLPPSSRKLFAEIRDAMKIRGGLVIPSHDERGFAGIIAIHHEDLELSSRAISALKLITLFSVERAKELLAETPTAPDPCPLSERQREVLSFAAAGKSECDTGEILGITGPTVREHMGKVRSTLGVRTKMQAIAVAVHRGWIMP